MDGLWWFYTVLLGAAFAQLAVGIALQWKTHIVIGDSMHWPTLLWQVFLLALTIEVWVSVGFYIRTLTTMSVLSLLAFLAVPMGILVLSVLLADQWWNRSPAMSDEERFVRVRRAFFIVLLAIPVINIAHELVLGSLALDADLFFPLAIAGGALAGLVVRARRADSSLAAAMVVLVVAYLLTTYGTVSVV